MPTLTCHTTDCGNAEIPIPTEQLVFTDPDTGEPYPALYVCGVCGQEITDVSE